MLVVLACNIHVSLATICPSAFSPVFVAAGIADAATRICQFILFLNMRLTLIIILLLSVTLKLSLYSMRTAKTFVAQCRRNRNICLLFLDWPGPARDPILSGPRDVPKL